VKLTEIILQLLWAKTPWQLLDHSWGSVYKCTSKLW